MPNTNDNQRLLPYLEGTLDATQAAEVEARLAADPNLAAEAAHLRQTLEGLRGAASRSQAPVSAVPPADLWPRLRSRITTEMPPRRVAAPRLWWAAGASLAAAALILVGVTQSPLTRPASPSAKPLVKTMPPQIAEGPKPSPRVAVPPLSSAGSSTLPFVPRTQSGPITQADPFALPQPQEAPSKIAIAEATRPLSPPVKIAAKNKPEQVASSSLNPRPDPELADSYYSHAALPPSAAVSAVPPVPPAPMAPLPPSSSATDRFSVQTPKSAFDKPADAPRVEPKEAFKAPIPSVDQAQKVQSLANSATPGESFAKPATPTLDDWQTALSTALRSPLWGTNAGMQQANDALFNAQMAGRLNDLRDRLDAQHGQSPTDVITGRMLAAVDEFGGSFRAALEERRRIVTLDGADGEDWFALAQSEERAGNSAAAKAAYGRALTSPVPPTPFHAGIAKQRSQ